MQYKNTSLLAAMALAGFLAGCGGSGNDDNQVVAPAAATPSSLGADGWATGTTGGAAADAAHVYVVTNRNELVRALYPNVAMNDDGSFDATGGPDAMAKIILLKGTISLNTNKAGKELTEADYICPVGSAGVTVKYDFNQYIVDNAPSVIGDGVDSKGAQEDARACAMGKQKNVVKIVVGSNTSILGVGTAAKIVHGNLSLPATSSNIVIRNISFEDSFDFFPRWEGSDSSGATGGYKGRWNSQYDLISVEGASNVWIDHNTFSDGTNIDKKYPPIAAWGISLPEQKVQHHDGLADVNKGSHKITMSYNHMKDHDKTGLVGGTDSATLTAENPLVLGVTYHHNYYQNNKQRQPRVRFGRVHVYNNYYTGQLANADGSGPDYPWLTAWTAGTASKLYIENNVLEVAAAADAPATPANANNIAGISTTKSNYNKCIAVAGKTWTNTDCETHFYDAGNLLNGAALDAYAEVAADVAANTASNQPVVDMKAAATPYWKPSSIYVYNADPTANVKAKVLANAGAGKL